MNDDLGMTGETPQFASLQSSDAGLDPFRQPPSDPAARRFETGKMIMGLTQTLIEAALLLALALTSIGGELASLIEAWHWPLPVVAPVMAVFMALGLEIITLPLSWLRGHAWERRFQLSRQTAGEWFKDYAKGVALGMVLLSVAVAIVYGAMLLSPDLWWLLSGTALFGGFALLARVTPTVLLPMFFKFEPLERPALKGKLDALAAKVGLRVEGIYQWGLGDKTRAANAAFTGTGRTRRVLLSDTLLEKFGDDEIEAVFAHELGHWRLGHIVKSLAMQGVGLIALLGLTHAVLRLAAPARPVGDLTLMPAIAVILMTASAVLMPFAMAMSRRFEFQADAFAVSAMARPAPLLNALRQLSALNLADPAPPRWIEILFRSHPSISRRIEAVRRLGLRDRPAFERQ